MLQWPWLKYLMIEIIYTLIATHITIVCVTLYLHRSQAHRGIEFHPVLSHAMRFWLWLTTGMTTKQWVAVHRKHHRFSDVEGDPHTPHVYGIWRVLFKGAGLYHSASKDNLMVQQYGVGTPSDWVERVIYTPHSRLGILLMLVIDLLLFGPWGFLVWGIQMIWIPFWAAGFINGIGHWWGYRNGETKDRSRNVGPWGILIGGEELHNNHHLDPANPKLSRKWFEFDIGWMWFKLFESVGLANIRITNPV
jgi:stearoyl-CoA desaturase (Delta-9 desaturase)